MNIPYVIDNQVHRLEEGFLHAKPSRLCSTCSKRWSFAAPGRSSAQKPTRRLEREDLRLICFHHLCS
jgi:hypothetical protein